MTDEQHETTSADVARAAMTVANAIGEWTVAYCEQMRQFTEALGKMAENPGVQAAMKEVARSAH